MAGFDSLGGALGSFGSAASDLMSAQAYETSAEGDITVANDYAQVVAEYGKEMNITKGSGAIQLGQQERQNEKVMGQQQAVAGAANVSSGGSAGDIMRDSMREGALAKMTIQGQTAIQLEGETVAQEGAQAQEDKAISAANTAQAQAGAAGVAGAFSMASGIFSLFSDRRLKRNIQLIGKENGFPLYSFQYVWSNIYYVGVMAQDILRLRPAAVTRTERDVLMVDYGMLGLKMRTLEEYHAQV